MPRLNTLTGLLWWSVRLVAMDAVILAGAIALLFGSFAGVRMLFSGKGGES